MLISGIKLPFAASDSSTGRSNDFHFRRKRAVMRTEPCCDAVVHLIRQRHRFTASAGGEGGQDSIGGVGEEANRAVAEGEMSAAGMGRPKMEGVALVIE